MLNINNQDHKFSFKIVIFCQIDLSVYLQLHSSVSTLLQTDAFSHSKGLPYDNILRLLFRQRGRPNGDDLLGQLQFNLLRLTQFGFVLGIGRLAVEAARFHLQPLLATAGWRLACVLQLRQSVARFRWAALHALAVHSVGKVWQWAQEPHRAQIGHRLRAAPPKVDVSALVQSSLQCKHLLQLWLTVKWSIIKI